MAGALVPPSDDEFSDWAVWRQKTKAGFKKQASVVRNINLQTFQLVRLKKKMEKKRAFLNCLVSHQIRANPIHHSNQKMQFQDKVVPKTWN